MKRIIALIAAAALLAPALAAAQERMSDARYLAASRCLAYADLPQLASDGADFTRLREAAETGRRAREIVAQAEESARRTRVTARSWGEDERSVAQLRERREDACAGFVETGLVQMRAAAPAL
jgi:hypothetical protein